MFDDPVQATGDAVADHLETIRGYFKDEPRVTLIVRNGDDPEKDFVMTQEANLQTAIEVLERRKASEAEGERR